MSGSRARSPANGDASVRLPEGDPRALLLHLLGEMVRRGASDLHVAAGSPPRFRFDGTLHEGEAVRAFRPKEAWSLASSILTDRQKERFEVEDELCVSFEVKGLSRFRASVSRCRGTIAMTVRRIPYETPSLEKLDLAPVVRRLAERPRGLVLVTGPAGSGRSTTLAAMVDAVSRARRGHVLTVEDPVEFVHPHRRSLVSQREVGTDTRSFTAALVCAMRQDVDVVLVSALPDPETVAAILTLAGAGHLVFGAVQAGSAVGAVCRILDSGPASRQARMRALLAGVLEGVVVQKLLPRARGEGLRAACAILIGTPAVRAAIRDGEVHRISALMEAGRKEGMQTMNDALGALYTRGEVTLDAALARSDDPEELLRAVGEAAPD